MDRNNCNNEVAPCAMKENDFTSISALHPDGVRDNRRGYSDFDNGTISDMSETESPPVSQISVRSIPTEDYPGAIHFSASSSTICSEDLSADPLSQLSDITTIFNEGDDEATCTGFNDLPTDDETFDDYPTDDEDDTGRPQEDHWAESLGDEVNEVREIKRTVAKEAVATSNAEDEEGEDHVLVFVNKTEKEAHLEVVSASTECSQLPAQNEACSESTDSLAKDVSYLRSFPSLGTEFVPRQYQQSMANVYAPQQEHHANVPQSNGYATTLSKQNSPLTGKFAANETENGEVPPMDHENFPPLTRNIDITQYKNDLPPPQNGQSQCDYQNEQGPSITNQATSTSWVDLAEIVEAEQTPPEDCGAGYQQGYYQQQYVYPQYVQSYPMMVPGTPPYDMQPQYNQSYQYTPYTSDGNVVYSPCAPVQTQYQQVDTTQIASNTCSTTGSQHGAANYYGTPEQENSYSPVYVQYDYSQPMPPPSADELKSQVEEKAANIGAPLTKAESWESQVPYYVATNETPRTQASFNERRYQLICENEAEFPDIGPNADELEYPYVYVSPAGLLTVLLRGTVAVELTLDQTIRVVNTRRGGVAATNAGGSSSCIFQRGIRILQDQTIVEAEFYKRRRAYLTTAESFFCVGDLCYRMCGADLYKTERDFTDLRNDITANVIYSCSSYDPDLVPKYIEAAQNAHYTNHRNGGISVNINGIRIYQNPRCEVEITIGEKFIRMSPRTGSTFVGTQWVEMAVENGGIAKVRRGGHYIYLSREDFSVTAGSIECGLDRTLHAFIKPVEVNCYPLNPNRFLNDPSIPKLRRRLRRNNRKQYTRSGDSLNDTQSSLDTTHGESDTIKIEDSDEREEEHDNDVKHGQDALKETTQDVCEYGSEASYDQYEDSNLDASQSDLEA